MKGAFLLEALAIVDHCIPCLIWVNSGCGELRIALLPSFLCSSNYSSCDLEWREREFCQTTYISVSVSHVWSLISNGWYGTVRLRVRSHERESVCFGLCVSCVISPIVDMGSSGCGWGQRKRKHIIVSVHFFHSEKLIKIEFQPQCQERLVGTSHRFLYPAEIDVNKSLAHRLKAVWGGGPRGTMSEPPQHLVKGMLATCGGYVNYHVIDTSATGAQRRENISIQISMTCSQLRAISSLHRWHVAGMSVELLTVTKDQWILWFQVTFRKLEKRREEKCCENKLESNLALNNALAQNTLLFW